MAKAILLDALQKTIGKYVKNLDPETLSVAVWKGKIELNSLELDVESINSMLDKKAEEAPNLAMPFKVISGRFESFEVDVPWSQIGSRSVTLRARGLSVVVEPLDRSSSQFFDDDDTTEHDVDGNTKRANKQKELREQLIGESDTYRLQAYALKKIALAADKNGASGGNEGDTSTFAQRLGFKIVENIQIEISDVHISLRNDNGAAGIVLDSVKLMTTDSQGNFVYVEKGGAYRRSVADDGMSFRYKMFRIQGLGIYLDEDEFQNARKSMRSISSISSISKDELSAANDNSSAYYCKSLGHTYVLAPLSFETRLRIADKKLCADYPKYELRSNLSMISFRLTRNQMDNVRKVAKIMTQLGPTPLFPEYRPLTLVKGNSREWWKYASRCIGRMSGKNLWVEFFQAYKKRKKYIPLFKRYSHHETCTWVKPLSSDELNDLVSIEQDRSISVEGLMVWRNIADGQIDKEREKRKNVEEEATSSYFSYVFGSRKANTLESEETQVGEEPAIILSAEEMKELEGIGRLDITENDVAKDSIYYDVKFVLDAMKIDLIGYDLNHVALLDMGKVTIDFDASMDGAFAATFALYDLEVFDRTTPNSLFTSVVKKIESGPKTNTSTALRLDVSKSATGDQTIALKMVGFQLVASKLMAQELQQFFQDSSNGPDWKKGKLNPLLSKSVSGSVDLFYDATQGQTFRSFQVPDKTEDDIKTNNAPEVKEKLSNKLLDVWNKKSQNEVSWMVDIDVKAPVVLIPEACNDPKANVMIFDLGHLKVHYGKGDPTASIQKWFDEYKYPRDSLQDEKFEVGTIDINDLAFNVQKASHLQLTHPDKASKSVIIDPIGIVIDFAIENNGPNFEPRSCFLGVIPTISLKLSPVQGFQILEVINSWTDMFSDRDANDQTQQPSVSSGSPDLKGSPNTAPSGQLTNRGEHESELSGEEKCAMIYCKIGLQRLTVTIVDERQKQLEAHLVSVYASILQCSDESSVINLTMGWFWILDWIASSYARNQRLLIHSNLPCSAESFAESNKYNVIEELTKQGVFERHYSGSTELADITFKTLPRSTNPTVAEDIIVQRNPEYRISGSTIRYVLDVKFRSLVVHWNPHAIKKINEISNCFLEVFTSNDSANEAGDLIMSPGRYQNSLRSERSEMVSHGDNIEGPDPLLIMAEMESLDIILNSARDDLPLFTLTVSGTRVSIVPRSDGQEISLRLDDLRVATPEKAGKTLPVYRTLLGIDDSSFGSLLTVKYCTGREAIETLSFESPMMENLEAVAAVELSPMRFCYIQSQVLTLVNYITEGIMGAITAKAAITAAEAAKELGNSVSGNSFYSIRATSFEAIVPEGAYRKEHMRLKTATLNVDYCMFSDVRGSDIRVTLSNLMVTGNQQKELQEAPIYLSINIKMPKLGVGSLDDQAMEVIGDISKAKFILSKYQYSQIMNTLDKNVRESALFLREDDCSGQIMTSAKETHYGVQLDESTQRIYFILNIGELSLVLNGQDREDPIVRLTATQTSISIDMVPDLEKFSMKALLPNLVCEDCRLVAQRRQNRYLINRSKQIDDVNNTDIFQIKYSQEGNKTNIDLAVGSPQVVLILDLISEILSFVGGRESENGGRNQPSSIYCEEKTSLLNEQAVQIDSSGNGEKIETNLRSSRSSITTITTKTGTCRFILMDLGTQYTIDEETIDNPEILGSRAQLSETVVTQGVFDAYLSMESDIDSGRMIASDFEFSSDKMEIFTAFGRELKTPLQILEPASASVSGSLTTTVTGDTEIEIRASALKVYFSLSTQNAALLMTIIDSVNESFKYIEDKEAPRDAKDLSPLTQKEKERILKLATELEKIEHSGSFADDDSINIVDSRALTYQSLPGAITPATATTKVRITVTMTQATVTFINDLQGMDEALFRISVTGFKASGDMVSPKTLFKFRCNTSILAEYFDSSVNIWSPLLLKPWEISVKGSRTHFKSNRSSSKFDLQSFPCWISFSEQFLVSLASAARMWTIYSAATNGALDQDDDNPNRTATTTTRNLNLITSLPNAVANHSGINVSFSLESGSIKDRACPTECTKYFRFDPPKGAGYGGTRVYGQDVTVPKIVKIKVEGSVAIVNMDLQLDLPPCAHRVGDNLVLFTRVAKEGKTTVLHLTSHIEVLNRTLIPFKIDFLYNETASEVGRCKAKSFRDEISSGNFSVPVPLLGNFQRDWQKKGEATLGLVITPVLTEIGHIDNNITELSGIATILVSLQDLRRAPGWRIKSKVEVTCRSNHHPGHSLHPLTLHVLFTMTLVNGGHVCIDASLQPRARVENKMPVAMKIRTPMPQTFSICRKEENGSDNETTYCVNPNECVEVFTPGPSIAITTRTRDNPIAGLELGWLDSGWVDLPLLHEFRLQDPIVSMFPLETGKSVNSGGMGTNREVGVEFFIVQGNDKLETLADAGALEATNVSPNLSSRSSTAVSKSNDTISDPLLFFLTVCNYGVDHTGHILFEHGTEIGGMPSKWQSSTSFKVNESTRGMNTGMNLFDRYDEPPDNLTMSPRRSSSRMNRGPLLPFGAFSSPIHRRRISLLPNPQYPIRLLLMTIEGTEGYKRTMPFLIEHLPIGDGGASTVPIQWENRQQTGLFAYRHLINEHQSEIHIIPEFLVFNGSESEVLVKEKAMPDVLIESGDTGQLRALTRSNGLKISFDFDKIKCKTGPLLIAKLGLKVEIVESYEGVPLGSVCIQTVIDTRGNSRLVVKVGEVKLGSPVSPVVEDKGIFDEDFFRFQIQWTELHLHLNEGVRKRRELLKRNTSPTDSTLSAANLGKGLTSEKIETRPSAINVFKHEPKNRADNRRKEVTMQPIMAMIFSGFNIDFQQIFSDKQPTIPRSQLSVIVHNIQIKDLTPNSYYPMVFDSTSDLHVFDLCIRTRGLLSADIVKVDLFDLNLAHKDRRSEKMTLTTSEEYVWRVLDLLNRILAASGEVSDFTLKYENDDNDNYVVRIEDSSGVSRSKAFEKNQYTTPTSDTLYHIAITRVSPFTIVLSFRRSPEQDRYQKVQDAPGAAVTNYFTRKLKFTIDKAELNFTRYEDRTLKGPSDRLIEALSTVYMGRMKFKVVSLLSAASLNDWRQLAAREGGDDEYIEGDILRATGNLAGKAAGGVLKTVGRGVGDRFARASSFMGDGIESGTSKIGARRFGTGVNNVVSGVGHGVGNTVSGVGHGASKILEGAGQGVGHVIGGVSGGALQIGKGIGKGITTGDGKAFVEGFAKGASTVGGGFAQGAEYAVRGTAGGLFTAGKGIFSGVKSVGKGIGGAIKGTKPSHVQRNKESEEKKRNEMKY